MVCVSVVPVVPFVIVVTVVPVVLVVPGFSSTYLRTRLPVVIVARVEYVVFVCAW